MIDPTRARMISSFRVRAEARTLNSSVLRIVSGTQTDLGNLSSVHGVSPASLHPAAIVAVVSFAFFMAMLIAFYIRQEIGFFVLSSAFLVLYLFTMVALVLQKRNTVKIYENGISYKKFTAC